MLTANEPTQRLAETNAERKRAAARVKLLVPVQVIGSIAVVYWLASQPMDSGPAQLHPIMSQFLLLVWWANLGGGPFEIRSGGYFLGMLVLHACISVTLHLQFPHGSFPFEFMAMYFTTTLFLLVFFVPLALLRSFFVLTWLPPSDRPTQPTRRDHLSVADLFIVVSLAAVICGLARLAHQSPWLVPAGVLLVILGGATYVHALAWAALAPGTPWTRLILAVPALWLTGSLLQYYLNPQPQTVPWLLLGNAMLVVNIAASFLLVRACGYRLRRADRQLEYRHRTSPNQT